MKQHTMKNLLLMAAFAAVILNSYSCKHENVAQEAIDRQSPEVCFESDILPLYQSFCAKSGCHNDAAHREGYALTSYEKIISKGIVPGSADRSKLYTVMFAGGESKMPPPGNTDLSDDQKALIRRWINQGAQHTQNCVAVCDTTSYKYNADIKPIFTQYCNGCHGGTNPSASLGFDTYALLKEMVDGDPELLMGTINHTPGYVAMPQAPAPKMPDCVITKIRKWVENGAPND